MTGKYSFNLSSEDSQRKFPGRIIIGQGEDGEMQFDFNGLWFEMPFGT
jgi:hypothetical protein